MIENLDFNHEAEIGIDIFLRKVQSVHPEVKCDLLEKAYFFAEKAHEGQKRISGEDYFIHPVNVAFILIKLRMDVDSIIAGLLHDVIEDCNVTAETLEKEFSPAVAQLVTGLTKIAKIKIKSQEESQAENFRKMIVAMSQDIRVIIVKLADRMHNMRTLQHVPPIKQKATSKETLDIYVPLAGRLGINALKAEMEDMCLRFLRPEVYYKIAEKVSKKKSERDVYIHDVVNIVKEKLQEYSVKAEVKGRPKHFYSIFKKIQQRGVEFENIQDMLAFRIIVSNISECYKCLGVIHSAFTPIPGRFKDYIAIPKANNYQSLHTTVIGPKAERIEIQIRTFEMHEIAETGIAAHWKYKEKLSGPGGGRKFDWIQDLLEFNKSFVSNSEFMDVVKNDLDIGGIFVFTPGGDVKELRPGSTPLDFAYAVHTEVGNLCVGAKVNGKIVPLKHRLKSGDVIEILTSKTQAPSKDWLKIVKTSRAKTKIRQWLLKTEREKQKIEGEEILEKQLKIIGQNIKTMKKKGYFQKVLDHYSYKTEEEFFIFWANKKLEFNTLAKIIPEYSQLLTQTKPQQEILPDEEVKVLKLKQKNGNQGPVIVDDSDDIVVRIAKCCNPIPGDPILGHITRGRGITIHTFSCKKKHEMDIEKTVKVHWNLSLHLRHSVMIKVLTQDRPGILSTISKSINNLGVNIKSAVAKSTPDHKGDFIFEIEIKDYGELLKVMSVIDALEEVISVSRA